MYHHKMTELEGKSYLRIAFESGNAFLLRIGESLVCAIKDRRALEKEWSRAELLARLNHGVRCD
jgi:hypothetical protein